MYIHRHAETHFSDFFNNSVKQGLLVPGIVGCGKTTLIEHMLTQLSREYECFSFSGDDITFRSAISRSGSFLHDHVKSRTSRKSLIFIDEIQKIETVFDALKIAYDKGNISFIASGSNPQFIKSKAALRLQRRASMYEMQPLSLPEILQAAGAITTDFWQHCSTLFIQLLFSRKELPHENEMPEFSVSQSTEETIDSYLHRGGLPLAWLSSSLTSALVEVKKVFERGFDPILKDTNNVSNIVAESLAQLHSQEFTYQGVMQRSKLTQRRSIIDGINALIAHGYLYAKEPWFPNLDHRSYITVYSFSDPGIVSYINGSMLLDEDDLGPRIEGVCHSRLRHLLDLLPVKTHLNYYKPYSLTSTNGIRFRGGEVDFVVRTAKRAIPIEVKKAATVDTRDLSVLCDLIKQQNLPYGIVLYGGKFKIDYSKRLIFWPWFLI